VKIRFEDIANSQKLIKIEVESHRVEEALDKAYSGIKKIARVPGYRPGKAPLDLLKAHYGGKANEEAVNTLIWDCYREAIAKEDIRPAGYPVVMDVDFDKGRPLSFSVKVDVNPEFRLRQYKAIKVNRRPYGVTDDDIDKAIKELQESMAQYNNIIPRPIKKGDYVVCLYECFEGGKLVDKKDKLWLYISDKLQPKELLSVLLGAEIDIEKQALVSYPQDYEYKELAGKQRLYKVTPKEIKEKIMPGIDDELAMSSGGFPNLEALKKAVKDKISNSKRLESERDLENQIYTSLLKTHVFDVPVSMVQRQIERLIHEAKQRLLRQGYKKEDIDSQDDKLKDSLRAQAENNVKLFFIIDRISKEEAIQAGPEDIDRMIRDISAKSGEAVEDIRERLKGKELTDALEEQIRHDKVVEFLIKNAKVNEPANRPAGI
jgi:trigger factor